MSAMPDGGPQSDAERPPYTVFVDNALARKDANGKLYYMYRIRLVPAAPGNDPIVLYRRYSELDRLQTGLTAMGIACAPLPPKVYFKRGASTVRQRFQGIQDFLDSVVRSRAALRNPTCLHFFNPETQATFAILSQCTRAGWMLKRGHVRKNWKQRWFVLKGTILYYCDSELFSEPIDMVDLNGADIRPEEGPKEMSHLIRIETPCWDKRELLLCTQTRDCQSLWIPLLMAAAANTASPVLRPIAEFQMMGETEMRRRELLVIFRDPVSGEGDPSGAQTQALGSEPSATTGMATYSFGDLQESDSPPVYNSQSVSSDAF